MNVSLGLAFLGGVICATLQVATTLADPSPQGSLSLAWKLVDQVQVPVGLATTSRGVTVLSSSFNAGSALMIGPSHFSVDLKTEGHLTDLSAAKGDLYASGEVDRTYLQEFLSEAPHTDMSLAKLSAAGDVIWQVNYSQPGWQSTGKVAADPDGGAVVLGADEGQKMLVWSVDAAGTTRWIKSFGTEPGDIVSLPSGGVAVLGTEGKGGAESYSEDAMLWFLDRDGNTIRTVTVRAGINTQIYNYFLRGRMVLANDHVVVETEWPDRFSKLQPPEIASFGLDGKLLWRKPVPDADCMSSLAGTPEGDILIACEEPYQKDLPRYFDLVRYDGRAGAAQSEPIALPACTDPHYYFEATLSSVMQGGAATLLGVQPEPGLKSYCAWVGQVPLPGTSH